MKALKERVKKADIYPFVGTPQLSQHIEDEVIKAVQAWLLSKYKDIMTGCDNPYCGFCMDAKEKKGLVDHIFEGYLLEYTADLPTIVLENTSHEAEAKPE